MKKKAHFWFLQNTSGGGLALPSLAEPTWGWRAEMRDWGPNHGAHPSSKTGHREGLGAPGWGAPTAPQSQLEGRSQPTWVSSSPSASPAFPSPGVFLIRFIFFCSPFTSRCRPWSRDFSPPGAHLEVATSMDEMVFSTSKVRARRAVEEENSTQRSSHLAVIPDITDFHHGKGEQRKGFKWLLLLVHLIFPPFADPFN